MITLIFTLILWSILYILLYLRPNSSKTSLPNSILIDSLVPKTIKFIISPFFKFFEGPDLKDNTLFKEDLVVLGMLNNPYFVPTTINLKYIYNVIYGHYFYSYLYNVKE
jgi:hypothetical protein